MDETYAPTHFVPAEGMRAWEHPDGTVPAVATLDPGLDVQVVEWRAGWARIVCSNGWGAWVDGRRLLDSSGGPPELPTAAPAAEEPAGATHARSGLAVRGVGIVSLIGVAAVVLGSFLDWWGLLGFSLDAWDIPVEYLITGGGGDGLKTGLVLLVVVVLVVPLLVERPFPAVVTVLIAIVPIALSLAALIRGLTEDPSADPQIGLFLTLAGGVAIAVDGLYVSSSRASAPRD